MSTLNTDCVNLPDTPRATVRDACELPDRELLRRFSAGRDADAFEQLVRRHGPMVLGVCRRMLRDADAADDAFQATFLVLVRKAASLRRPELLGNWLYGVAVRIATRARIQVAKRLDNETRTDIMVEPPTPDDVERRELQTLLDEELSQLPSTFREPLILCYLQGMTHAEAARLLGCPVGSMSGRLAAARDKLRARLGRRGVSTSAGLFAAVLFANAAQCEVPRGLVQATVRAAVGTAARQTALLGVSSQALDLARSVLRDMRLQVAKVTAIVLLTVGAVIFCLFQAVSPTSAGDPRSVASRVSPAPTAVGANMAVYAASTAPSAAADNAPTDNAQAVSAQSATAQTAAAGHRGTCCGK